MLSSLLVVGVLLLAVAVAARLWLPRATTRRPDQVDAFASAREVTNRWSSDPASAPPPIREFLHEQQREPGTEQEQ